MGKQTWGYRSADGALQAHCADGETVTLMRVSPVTSEPAAFQLTWAEWRAIHEWFTECRRSPAPPRTANSSGISITQALDAAQSQQLDALTTLIRGIVRDEISRMAVEDHLRYNGGPR